MLRYHALVAVGVILGVVVGLGAFTFHYGEGMSYFSEDPNSCINCHIMQPHYDSWLKGSHHAAARCVDCHLPHDTIPKYIAKADNGFHHSVAFTFQVVGTVEVHARPHRLQLTAHTLDPLGGGNGRQRLSTCATAAA